jgi:hypothetical protein
MDVADRVVDEVPAYLDDLEPVEVAQRLGRAASPLRIAWSTPVRVTSRRSR